MTNLLFVNDHSWILKAFIFAFVALTATLATGDMINLNTTNIDSLQSFHVSSENEIMIKTEFDMIVSVDQFKNFHSNETGRNKRKAIHWHEQEFHKWGDLSVSYTGIANRQEVCV